MASIGEDGAHSAARGQPSQNGWYVVGICMVAYVLSFVDRQILALMIGPIQADLGISDTQFGLLHGLAFAIFYATMGIPLASLADRVSRPLVISVGIAVWSAATLMCGLARGFTQLFIARIFVGAGEAGLSPATYSLISDLFPRERLGRAYAVYSMGSFLGAGLAFLAGGAVIAAVGGIGEVSLLGHPLRAWQLVFLIVGAPGFLLAAIMALSVRDPGRSGGAAQVPGLPRVLAHMGVHRAIYIPHVVGYTFAAMALFALLGWAPALLMRTQHLGAGEAGGWLGMIALVFGVGGVLASGWIMDALTRKGHLASPFTTGIVGAVGTLLFAALLPFADGFAALIAALCGLMFFASFPMPPSTAVMQMAAPPAMRSRVSAIFLCSNSLIGSTLGALFVGLLNDRVFAGQGGGAAGAGVAASLACVTGGAALVCALVLSRGCAPFARLVRS
ncbi:spinster family MFS transporter [Novosphingobium mangrovi (ex Hu et al. 2023)]|uniref:MFS transporter n=1 Tax=Novosphingobium mangrovi (ex Hu et al. 2023) TaxID=2930094 RepID=A0ABT0AE60_9SPHN|nr:MFS transporter [Novosphingobium mangrovi (ex Hu et al. 2023)]MCJ1961487.1 MFS transporter [Novosphingobium mangrovi (ex Hu et al. 2023)]